MNTSFYANDTRQQTPQQLMMLRKNGLKWPSMGWLTYIDRQALRAIICRRREVLASLHLSSISLPLSGQHLRATMGMPTMMLVIDAQEVLLFDIIPRWPS